MLCAASTQRLWASGKPLLRDGFLAILYGRMGAVPGHKFFWKGVP
jgi:hypothetical protein